VSDFVVKDMVVSEIVVNYGSDRAVRPAVPNTAFHSKTTHRARRTYRGAQSARGFTLIEIVIAFAILAIGLGISMQIASGAMRNTRQAAVRTDAALYAQSLLDTVGVGERLEEGETSGDFNEDFRWTLRAEAYEIETDTPIEAALAPVQLYRLELVVTWDVGRKEQEARFVTLRALTPEMGN
jgi:general secretion pathway protein I